MKEVSSPFTDFLGVAKKHYQDVIDRVKVKVIFYHSGVAFV